MTGVSKTFRVFVSSTFRDMEAERNVLQERVFPALKELCRARGHRFQEIDLRWGVSDEASLDQQALNICLAEIAHCRETTPRPNFIVLLGNRHGWLALPPQVPAEDLDLVRSRVGAEECGLLEDWYVRDDNAVPPQYHLRPRERGGPFTTYDAWRSVEERLHAALRSGARGTRLEGDPRFEASATEQEVLAGAVAHGEDGHAFAFVRDIVLGERDPRPGELEPGSLLLTFVDPDQSSVERLRRSLAHVPTRVYRAGWDRERQRPTTGHLADFARDVEEVLRAAILSEIEGTPGAPEADDAEARAHREFAEERRRHFVGRESALAAVAAYIGEGEPAPMVVVGDGGTGKSSLLAEALRRAERDHPDTDVLCRFVGATPGSSSERGLVSGLCHELAGRGAAPDTPVPTDYDALCADLRERLTVLGAAGRVLLLIDSLDQLQTAGQGERLAWVPGALPPGVRLVLSTRPGMMRDALAARTPVVLQLGPMGREEGADLLNRWLADCARTLRGDQRDAVLGGFVVAGGNPLHLRLAFELARGWRSDDPPQPLPDRVREMVAVTFARLADQDRHGRVFVSHALGYLAASRHGLSEDELVDVLSRDPDVYADFLRQAQHVPPDLAAAVARSGRSEELAAWLAELRTETSTVPARLRDFLEELLASPRGPRLPVVLWSRLAFDLRPYLALRVTEGADLIGFYHRELGDVARAQFLQGHEEHLHGRLAGYFMPGPTGEGRRRWGDATLHGLVELPFQLTRAGDPFRDDLYATLTDFEFIEAKVTRVGVERHGSDDDETLDYTGVRQLEDDFDLVLDAWGAARPVARRRVVVTPTDLGQGLVLACPHCRVSHGFDGTCAVCGTRHQVEEWLGREATCPAPGCGGPWRVNRSVVGRAVAGQAGHRGAPGGEPWR